MTTEKHILLGRWIGISSLCFSTIIFILIYFSFITILKFFAFALFLGLINLAVLIAISIKANDKKENRKPLVRICVFLLLTIIVLMGYVRISMTLSDIMRIKFTNATPSELNDILIMGCEVKAIDKLQPGESKTIWVEITNDCSVYIEYLINDKQQREEVEGYLCGGLGYWKNYIIRINKPGN